ncbi:P-loop containing nucleoside triphosphate hydrolase protein [Rhizophagus clarus]|uniref:P-loop containing nucleoside triphosphate hydrolase protein n=1 Tax=Rhizophagus clarus TaxID=94130 RepID=A0A8H3R0H9_9GLOM|nr:P-loop containing nucleoside triphosphate hydrolase protein [Rhizophagus clarus]
MTYYFHRSILSSRLITRQVMLQQVALRNSNPFQSSLSSPLSRSYTNSTIHLSSRNIPSKESTSPLNLNNKIGNQFPNTIFVKYVMAGVASLVLVDLLHTGYQNRHNLKTVEKDTDDKLVPRPKVVDRLIKIFQPDEDQINYNIIYGNFGTGKTTLIKIALSKIGQVEDKNNKVTQDGGTGIIYVDVPVNPSFNNFGDVFIKALKFASSKENIFSTKHLNSSGIRLSLMIYY